MIWWRKWNIQEGMKHQMRGATQAQHGMTLQSNMLPHKNKGIPRNIWILMLGWTNTLVGTWYFHLFGGKFTH
jgi:hypothetical protein